MKILCEERKIYFCAPEEIGCARAEMMDALGRRLMEKEPNSRPGQGKTTSD